MNIKKTFTIKPQDGTEFIADAFGIYNNFENKILDLTLPKTLPLITYITGESGCGKTTLMKELGYDETKKLIIPDKPLFLWHSDENIALQLLSFVGLGEATLFMQKYENLSDSQKFRAKIFLYLLSDEKTIFIDGKDEKTDELMTKYNKTDTVLGIPQNKKTDINESIMDKFINIFRLMTKL